MDGEHSGEHAGKPTARLKRFISAHKALSATLAAVPLVAVVFTIASFVDSHAANEISNKANGYAIEKAEEAASNPIGSTREVDVRLIDREYDLSESSYPLFDDRINPSEDFVFADLCATQAIITNNSDKEITLTSVSYEVKNVQINYEPDIVVYATFDSTGSMNLDLINQGWGDLENATLVLQAIEGGATEYLGERIFEIPVEQLEYGTSESVKLLDGQLAKEIPDSTLLRFSVSIVAYDGTSITTKPQTVGAYASGGKFVGEGLGASSQFAYGVLVYTEQGDQSESFQTTDYILPGRSLTVPICVAVDKSCSFDFCVNFEYIKAGEPDKIQMDAVHLSFSTPSIYAGFGKTINDAAELDGLVEGSGGTSASSSYDVLYTYPYEEWQAKYAIYKKLYDHK